MNISSVQNYNFSFNARKSDIREADRIMRASKRTFPVVSSSYIDHFYHSETPRKDSLKRKVSYNVFDKINNIRIFDEKLVAPGLNIPKSERNIMYAPILRGMEQMRAGNCYESAVGVLAALAANGIYDAKIVNLYLETEFINKKDGICEYTRSDEADHCFVVTSMGRNSSKEDDIVVIDPWLSFTDSVSSAKARYKQVFQSELRKELFYEQWSHFKNQKAGKGEEVDLKDYNISQKLYFRIPDFSKVKSNKNLGEYAANNFPSLVVG